MKDKLQACTGVELHEKAWRTARGFIHTDRLWFLSIYINPAYMHWCICVCACLCACVRVCLCLCMCVCACCWSGQSQQSSRRLSGCEVPGSILKQTSWLTGCMFSCVCVFLLPPPPLTADTECSLFCVISALHVEGIFFLIRLCYARGGAGMWQAQWFRYGGCGVFSLFRLPPPLPPPPPPHYRLRTQKVCAIESENTHTHNQIQLFCHFSDSQCVFRCGCVSSEPLSAPSPFLHLCLTLLTLKCPAA